MTSSEFVLLSALRDHPHGEIVDVLVRDLHQSEGLNPSELTEILQAMYSDGLVRRSAGAFLLSRVEITGKGIVSLEEYNQLLKQRQQAEEQLAAEKAQQEIERKTNKRLDMLDRLINLIASFLGVVAAFII